MCGLEAVVPEKNTPFPANEKENVISRLVNKWAFKQPKIRSPTLSRKPTGLLIQLRSWTHKYMQAQKMHGPGSNSSPLNTT